MTLTCDTANKMIRQWNNEIDELQEAEKLRCTFTTTAARKEEDRPPYNFSFTQKTIDDLNLKIIKVRHAVNLFNVSEVLPCGLTIDQALVRLAHLNGQKLKLNEMSRILEAGRPNSGPYGKACGPDDYRFRNFNDTDALILKDDITAEILRIQQELNIANVTKTFEVDI